MRVHSYVHKAMFERLDFDPFLLTKERHYQFKRYKKRTPSEHQRTACKSSNYTSSLNWATMYFYLNLNGLTLHNGYSFELTMAWGIISFSCVIGSGSIPRMLSILCLLPDQFTQYFWKQARFDTTVPDIVQCLHVPTKES